MLPDSTSHSRPRKKRKSTDARQMYDGDDIDGIPIHKTKKTERKSKKIPKKRMKKKMSPRSSPDDNDSDLDLSKDLQPIGTFLKDRTRLISEMFAALKPKKIRNLLPEILKKFSMEELQAFCVDQIEIMSKKRIMRLITGEKNDEISSSGTEDESDMDDVIEIEMNPKPDSTSGELDINVGRELASIKPHSIAVNLGRQKPIQPQHKLDILELELRARAIKKMLAHQKAPGEETSSMVREPPPNDDISVKANLLSGTGELMETDEPSQETSEPLACDEVDIEKEAEEQSNTATFSSKIGDTFSEESEPLYEMNEKSEVSIIDQQHDTEFAAPQEEETTAVIFTGSETDPDQSDHEEGEVIEKKRYKRKNNSNLSGGWTGTNEMPKPEQETVINPDQIQTTDGVMLQAESVKADPCDALTSTAENILDNSNKIENHDSGAVSEINETVGQRNEQCAAVPTITEDNPPQEPIRAQKSMIIQVESGQVQKRAPFIVSSIPAALPVSEEKSSSNKTADGELESACHGAANPDPSNPNTGESNTVSAVIAGTGDTGDVLVITIESGESLYEGECSAFLDQSKVEDSTGNLMQSTDQVIIAKAIETKPEPDTPVASVSTISVDRGALGDVTELLADPVIESPIELESPKSVVIHTSVTPAMKTGASDKKGRSDSLVKVSAATSSAEPEKIKKPKKAKKAKSSRSPKQKKSKDRKKERSPEREESTTECRFEEQRWVDVLAQSSNTFVASTGLTRQTKLPPRDYVQRSKWPVRKIARSVKDRLAPLDLIDIRSDTLATVTATSVNHSRGHSKTKSPVRFLNPPSPDIQIIDKPVKSVEVVTLD